MSSDEWAAAHHHYPPITPMDITEMLGQHVHPAFLEAVRRTTTAPSLDSYANAHLREVEERERAGWEQAAVAERHRKWQRLFADMRTAVEQPALPLDADYNAVDEWRGW